MCADWGKVRLQWRNGKPTETLPSPLVERHPVANASLLDCVQNVLRFKPARAFAVHVQQRQSRRELEAQHARQVALEAQDDLSRR